MVLTFRSKLIICLLGLVLLPDSSRAQEESIYMSVLSSRKHRIGASDNPLVGLFVSADRGLTWSHSGWREYIRMFSTRAGTDSTLWSACGNGVLRSTDNGRTWRITTGWDVTEVLQVVPHPTDPRLVFAATAYGIIRSTDRGENWTVQRKGFRTTFTSDLVIDRARPGRLLAASESGVYVSTDNGDSWALAGLGGIITNVLLQDPLTPNILWAGTEEKGLFRSDDGGRSWRDAGRKLHGSPVYSIAVHPMRPSLIFVGTYGQGVFRSRDGGLSWEAVNRGIGNLDIHSLLVLPGDPVIVLAGTLNGGLYRSSDGGTNWTFNSQEDSQVWGLSVRVRGK
jgi:photosystem II stability/assembly factor-like uncharacterized protein